MNEEVRQKPARQGPPQKRSGSQRRLRSRILQVAMTPEEFDTVLVKAKESGLSPSSYGRASMLGHEGPRAQRSPPINGEIMGHGIAALNKVGNNLNQLAHGLNAGRAAGLKDTEFTLKVVRAAVAMIMEALGRKDRS